MAYNDFDADDNHDKYKRKANTMQYKFLLNFKMCGVRALVIDFSFHCWRFFHMLIDRYRFDGCAILLLCKFIFFTLIKCSLGLFSHIPAADIRTWTFHF